jgi:hypothetical protein
MESESASNDCRTHYKTLSHVGWLGLSRTGRGANGVVLQWNLGAHYELPLPPVRWLVTTNRCLGSVPEPEPNPPTPFSEGGAGAKEFDEPCQRRGDS